MVRCLICTDPVKIERVFDIPILWDDDCNFGKSVCNECLHLLIELVKGNKNISISWKEDPEPCRSKVRHQLGLDKEEPQKTIMRWVE